MRPAAGATSGLALLLLASGAFARDPLRPSTGADGSAPAHTSFATPPAAVAYPAPFVAAAGPGAMRIEDVAIAAEPGIVARPARRWAPVADAVTGLRLVHRLGEPLDAAWIRRQFAANDLIGRIVGYDRLTALVQQINLAFLQNGFLNSGVLLLPQAPGGADGIVRLRLVYGRLVAPAAGGAAIIVTWRHRRANGLSVAFLRHRMPAAADHVPLNMEAIEQDFRRLADDPAIRTVNADIRPGTNPGEASLLLDVDPQPRVDFYASAANSRSPSVGGERLAAGGLVRNALTPGDILSAEYGSTSGLTDFLGGYSAPLLGPGGALQVHGGFNNAAVVDRPLVPLNIHSREWYVEGGPSKRLFDRPLLPGDAPGSWVPAETATAGILIVHRRVTSTLLGEPFSFSPGTERGRIEYSAIRFTGDYTSRSPATVFALSVTGTVGIEGTRSDRSGPRSPSQSFTALLVQANYAHRLTEQGLELRLRLAGQAAGGILYSPERFAAGGADTVRGYRESLLLADEAVVGSVELARPFHIGRLRPSGAGWGSFVLAAFVDAAMVHNRAGGQPLPDRIESTGVSLDWTPLRGIFARATFGQPLKFVRATGDRNIQDRGFEFRVVIHPLQLFRASS